MMAPPPPHWQQDDRRHKSFDVKRQVRGYFHTDCLIVAPHDVEQSHVQRHQQHHNPGASMNLDTSTMTSVTAVQRAPIH